MDSFNDSGGQLWAEEVPLATLAERFGTPCYVYSRATLERHYLAFARALGEQPGRVCYAVKANANLAVLNVLARLGAGFDIVSGGELERVLQAGGDPRGIVFSGVGKTSAEMGRALEAGILCFNLESEAELERLGQIARDLGRPAPVSLRVNPDVDAGTHPYISTGLRENKFGISTAAALDLYRRAADHPWLEVRGLDCHIGSQLTSLAPFLDALDLMLELVDRLTAEGIALEHLDIGGGLGVRYRDETPPSPAAYMAAVIPRLAGRNLELILEPGRAIAANAGVLLTRVEYLKTAPERNFAVVDAAMNDLIRPALYSAYQDILPVQPRDEVAEKAWDIVGPICETGDFLGKERRLALAPGDLLAVRSCGAYGFGMASNYNSRNRPAEVMVDADQAYLVRERETLEQQMRGEHLLPD